MQFKNTFFPGITLTNLPKVHEALEGFKQTVADLKQGDIAKKKAAKNVETALEELNSTMIGRGLAWNPNAKASLEGHGKYENAYPDAKQVKAMEKQKAALIADWTTVKKQIAESNDSQEKKYKAKDVQKVLTQLWNNRHLFAHELKNQQKKDVDPNPVWVAQITEDGVSPTDQVNVDESARRATSLNYAVLNVTDADKIKRYEIPPGNTLSYQVHRHRAEYHIVVDGEGEYIQDGKVRKVRKGDIIRLDKKVHHACRSSADKPLSILEYQYGSTTDENDNIRVVDAGGRIVDSDFNGENPDKFKRRGGGDGEEKETIFDIYDQAFQEKAGQSRAELEATVYNALDTVVSEGPSEINNAIEQIKAEWPNKKPAASFADSVAAASLETRERLDRAIELTEARGEFTFATAATGLKASFDKLFEARKAAEEEVQSFQADTNNLAKYRYLTGTEKADGLYSLQS